MVGKRKLAMLLCTVLVGGILAGCGQSATDSNKGTTTSADVKNIGVIQIVQHDALDAANKGFVDGLKEKGYEEGKNIKIEQQNAQGDMANAQTIAKQFADSKKDLIFAIATPSAQAAYNATKEIPIVVTAVTDPVKAEVAKDWKSSGTNVTGTSDKVPVDKQIELLKKLIPNAKTVGVIYNTSETNSVIQVDELKAEAKKQGLAVKEIGVTNVNEINQNLASALGQIDVLYTPTDNTVASGYPLVGKLCVEKNIPIIGAEEAIVTKGGLASIGIDYYKLGKEAGFKAAEVLGGKKPSEVEISTLSEMSFTINTDVAKKLNITIPQDIESKAKKGDWRRLIVDVLINILEQGLLFSLVAIAVYITYKILDFPDMSVDGTFPMGAAISATLLVHGVNPWISIIIAAIGGAIAGAITGILHVKFKIDNLMAGILVMIGLYSINLRIMGKANVPLLNTPSVFNNKILNMDIISPKMKFMVIIIPILVIVKILFDLYFKTKSGFLLRAVGDNEQVVSSIGVNKNLVKILGLVISNALVGMAGALTAQYQGFSDVGMGTGTVVMALAAVIIGSSFFERVSFIKATTLSILGAIIYKGAIALVLKYGGVIGLTANDLKLMTAIIVVIALCSNNGFFKFKKKKLVEGGAQEDAKSQTTIQSI